MFPVVKVSLPNRTVRLSLNRTRVKVAIGGAAAYIVTLVGLLMLAIPLTSTPIRRRADNNEPSGSRNPAEVT